MSLLSRLQSWWSRLSAGDYPWPALDITLPGGRYLHLVGSVHMGTRDMAPLSSRLIQKIAAADALIVEADISSDAAPFDAEENNQLLRECIGSELYTRLEQRINELGLSPEIFSHLPPWQVAIVLQNYQAQQLGLRSVYGIDHQMIQAAKQSAVPVQELEGLESQLTLLKSLPDQGRGLLEDSLSHWHTNARQLQLMISWWQETAPRQKTEALPATFNHELYDVLMCQRNHRWRNMLEALPPGRYVVAVGALHIYGEGNLPALLRAG